ncbi:hypothetical protein KUW04_18330 [Halomonas denitrificans]|uniref:hypothetical protein n=1 Tax=Ferrimonas balearica TaxID=44012 RepID=UPI001C595370|nr:hypothetical protein [Ferrimonas balearica]MBW3141507.1 hypothetical protein [Ferrimonas balearica]MBY6019735.1 hypothetical protein [Halomonas denitrificans]MBY6108628.1 hypothetical protein [Ferrimonas balearica]
MLDWLEYHGTTPSEHQLHLRQKLWQHANQRYRHSELPIEWRASEHANLEALLKILNTDDANEALLAVEVNRQLGAFDVALRMLDSINVPLPLDLVTQVVDRIEAEDRRVFRVDLSTGIAHANSQ